MNKYIITPWPTQEGACSVLWGKKKDEKQSKRAWDVHAIVGGVESTRKDKVGKWQEETYWWLQ